MALYILPACAARARLTAVAHPAPLTHSLPRALAALLIPAAPPMITRPLERGFPLPLALGFSERHHPAPAQDL